MGLTAQQELITKYGYYEVYDKNNMTRYGLCSDVEKEEIERRYDDKLIFKKIDFTKIKNRWKII